MKYSFKVIALIAFAFFALNCGGSSDPATPVETLKAYTTAVKLKDVKMMKMLLSEASLKLHAEQAKAQNVSVDEIVQRETLFSAGQRVFDYRNEKIDGDKATVEVKNDIGGWDIVYFVKEAGLWKIDKKGFSDEIINQNEEAERKLDEQIESQREDANSNSETTDTAQSNTNGAAPDPNATASPNATPEPNATSDPKKPATTPIIQGSPPE
ncbi:MAG: hypothetical protein KDB79_08240 [Acidobacteria bacterium]|nr:hypothetical protein [Acidobacteriota bacterium]